MLFSVSLVGESDRAPAASSRGGLLPFIPSYWPRASASCCQAVLFLEENVGRLATSVRKHLIGDKFARRFGQNETQSEAKNDPMPIKIVLPYNALIMGAGSCDDAGWCSRSGKRIRRLGQTPLTLYTIDSLTTSTLSYRRFDPCSVFSYTTLHMSRLSSISLQPILAVLRTEHIMQFPKGLTSPLSPSSSRNSEPSSWEANVAASQGRNAKITVVSFHGLFRKLAAAKLMMSQ